MTAIQDPKVQNERETIADICERYDVAKLVATTFANQYVVYYRKDRPGPGMSKYFELERAIADATGQPADLISAGAPCISWPKYQKAIKDGTVLYQC